MTAARNQRSVDMLFLPGLILLALLFVFPVLLFFIRSASEAGGLMAFTQLILAKLQFEPVQNAFLQTIVISFEVTVLALILAYPISFFLTVASPGAFSVVILCIVVPYFTSIIVRTYSWMVLLGRNGVINHFLMNTGIIDHPIELMYNRTAILIAMVYIMLPYMVLTLFTAMKRIDLGLVRAASGMGAGPVYAFRKVYFPLSAHGVISGALIVFILCMGFFITPALMGGSGDVMIAMLIQQNVEIAMDWSSAAAVSVLLFAATAILFAIYTRFSDFNRLMGQ